MTDWLEISGQLADGQAARWIDPDVLGFIEQLPREQPILAACSGGADSVFLTLVLHSIFRENPGRLHLLHFNHQTRGEDSDGDAAFVREMARALGVPFETGCPDGPVSKGEHALRKARYDWLTGVYRRVGAGALALGHHADDLIESQLMALFTGSGPSGLASPMPVRAFPDGHVRVRPLVGVKREAIIRELGELDAPFRTDCSNEDVAYTRNRLRNEVMSGLKTALPQDIHSSAIRTRRLMSEVLEALDAQVASLNLDFGDPLRFPCQSLFGQPAGLVRRAVMGWWFSHHPDTYLPTLPLDRIVEAIASGSTEEFVSAGRMEGLEGGSQVFVIHDDGTLLIRPERAPAPLRWRNGIHWDWAAGPLFLPGGASLSGKKVFWEDNGKLPYKNANSIKEAWVNGAEGPFLVRQWESGDKFMPLGAPGRRKLQDLFSDAKLNSEQKHATPVIFNREGVIVWVPGFPPADRFKICHEANSALQLTYTRQLTLFPDHHGGYPKSKAQQAAQQWRAVQDAEHLAAGLFCHFCDSLSQ
jgi:tRNA(Ile)-lysidine synthase